MDKIFNGFWFIQRNMWYNINGCDVFCLIVIDDMAVCLTYNNGSENETYLPDGKCFNGIDTPKTILFSIKTKVHYKDYNSNFQYCNSHLKLHIIDTCQDIEEKGLCLSWKNDNTYCPNY